MWQEFQEICAINAQSDKSNKSAVIVIISMRSLVLHQTAEVQEALWQYTLIFKKETIHFYLTGKNIKFLLF